MRTYIICENLKASIRVNTTYQRDIHYLSSTYFSLRNILSKLEEENCEY